MKKIKNSNSYYVNERGDVVRKLKNGDLKTVNGYYKKCPYTKYFTVKQSDGSSRELSLKKILYNTFIKPIPNGTIITKDRLRDGLSALSIESGL